MDSIKEHLVNLRNFFNENTWMSRNYISPGKCCLVGGTWHIIPKDKVREKCIVQAIIQCGIEISRGITGKLEFYNDFICNDVEDIHALLDVSIHLCDEIRKVNKQKLIDTLIVLKGACHISYSELGNLIKTVCGGDLVLAYAVKVTYNVAQPKKTGGWSYLIGEYDAVNTSYIYEEAHDFVNNSGFFGKV